MLQRGASWLFFLFAAAAFLLLGNYYFYAHTEPANPALPIRIDSSGAAWQGNSLISRGDLSGRILIPLVTPRNVSQETDIDLTITFGAPAQGAVTASFVSIQGTDGMGVYWSAADQLQAFASGVVPDSYTGLSLSAPPGYFQPSLLGRIYGWLSQGTLADGILAGLTACLLAFVLSYRPLPTLRSPSAAPRSVPPSDLTPLQIAILHHGAIRPLDLIACFFNLSQRGYLHTIDSEKGVVFIRTAKADGLSDFERGLLALLFAEGKQIGHLDETLERIDRELFSALVSQIYIDMYASLEKRSLFKENPRITHLRQKTVGIGVQFTGIALLGGGALPFLQPFPWLLTFGLLLYLAGAIIYSLGRQTVLLDRKGSSPLLKEIRSFVAYLSAPSPFPGSLELGPLLYDYMPYALVTDTIGPWINRFRLFYSPPPEWYTKDVPDNGNPARFMQNIYLTAESFSRAAVSSLDPNVD